MTGMGTEMRTVTLPMVVVVVEERMETDRRSVRERGRVERGKKVGGRVGWAWVREVLLWWWCC